MKPIKEVKLCDLSLCDKWKRKLRNKFGDTIKITRENLRWITTERKSDIDDVCLKFYEMLPDKLSNRFDKFFMWCDQTPESVAGLIYDVCKTGKLTKKMCIKNKINLRGKYKI